MKVGPKSSLRPFLHRALQLMTILYIHLKGMKFKRWSKEWN